MYVRFGVAVSLTSGSSLGQADVAMTTQYTQCGQIVGNWVGHLDAVSSTDEKIVPITGWIAAILTEKVQAAGVISGRLGNIQAMLCYRTAGTSVESPSAWVVSPDLEAAWHAADGEFNTGELTTTITSNMWIQLGLRVKLSSGSSLGQMDISVTSCVRRA